MKKTVLLIVIAALLLTICACVPKVKEMDITDLSGYSIVYPSDWSEWRMEDVHVLEKALEYVAGEKILLVPDTEEATGKEIILASSSRETCFSEEISAFDNAMCYVIGYDGDNIILGGQNYYSDMRAIYDFVNNYLGYDDMEDKWSEGKTSIPEKTVTLWEEPDFHIMGSNFSCFPFKKASQVKDFADAGFDLLHIGDSKVRFEEDDVKNIGRWCARFGIQLMLMPITDKATDTPIVRGEEELVQNPAMWGLYLIDEPLETGNIPRAKSLLKDAKERFSQYGWKECINFALHTYSITNISGVIELDDKEHDSFKTWREEFSDCDVFSYDGAPYLNNFQFRDYGVCYVWQEARKLADSLNQECFVYIDAFQLKTKGGNASKMFRSHSYLAMCFGADAVEYFQYGDASAQYPDDEQWKGGSLVTTDFEKTVYYDDAKQANKETKEVRELLDGYEFVGTSVISDKDEICLRIMDEYDITDLIEFVDQAYTPDEYIPNKFSLLVGVYKSKEKDSYRLLIMDTDELNDTVYGEDEEYEAYFKVNGRKATLYEDSEVTELEVRDSGYCTINLHNGSCFVLMLDGQ